MPAAWRLSFCPSKCRTVPPSPTIQTSSALVEEIAVRLSRPPGLCDCQVPLLRRCRVPWSPAAHRAPPTWLVVPVRAYSQLVVPLGMACQVEPLKCRSRPPSPLAQTSVSPLPHSADSRGPSVV